MSDTDATTPAPTATTKQTTKPARTPRTPAELRREAERLQRRAQKLAELAADRDQKRHRDRAAIIVGATIAAHASPTLKRTIADLLSEHLRPQDIEPLIGADWADWALAGYGDADTDAARQRVAAAAKAAAEARIKSKEQAA